MENLLTNFPSDFLKITNLITEISDHEGKGFTDKKHGKQGFK